MSSSLASSLSTWTRFPCSMCFKQTTRQVKINSTCVGENFGHQKQASLPWLRWLLCPPPKSTNDRLSKTRPPWSTTLILDIRPLPVFFKECMLRLIILIENPFTPPFTLKGTSNSLHSSAAAAASQPRPVQPFKKPHACMHGEGTPILSLSTSTTSLRCALRRCSLLSDCLVQLRP